ncbi:hypothetical protein MDAP_000965 [Mitosporidium daphniae]|uniref:SAP domain-containing protein n=1 Tax=Mitosporidium daphniae TaxID=1485682 RepID=A0A098VUM7_9MICR|nr:uncharacterized protein DI09_132p60 [Mitosporidium daphniae]KGG52813.1 hypothetical protein DI09_132p60 [Mitosporidium daphniae]|eukprot:XP_013239249.1 uncharacterized protein DI09_132p60 [Mitosporidium daphniae]
MASFSIASSNALPQGTPATLSGHDTSTDYMFMADQFLFDDQLASSFLMPGMFDSFDCNFDLSDPNFISKLPVPADNDPPSLQDCIRPITDTSSLEINKNQSRPVEYFENSSIGEMGDLILPPMSSDSDLNGYFRENWNGADATSSMQYQYPLYSHSTGNLNRAYNTPASYVNMGSKQYFGQPQIFSGHHPVMTGAQGAAATIKVPISSHKPNVQTEIKRTTPLMLPFHHKNDNRIIPVRNFSAQHQVAAAAAYLASSASFPPPSNNGVYSPNHSSGSFAQTSPFQITVSIGDIQSTKKDFLKRADEIDYSNVTVVELKNFLREFHQASGGKKADLVERIRYICNYLRGEEVAISAASSSVQSQSPQMNGGLYSTSPQLPYNIGMASSPQFFSNPITTFSQQAANTAHSYFN